MKKQLKQLICLTVSTSLAFSPAYGQTQSSVTNDIASGVKVLGSATNQILQTVMSVNQSAIDQRQAATIKSDLESKLLLESPTTLPKRTPDAFFKQCGLLPAKSVHPEGACENPISSPVDIARAMTLIDIARNNANAYENETIPGYALGKKTGLQCLQDNKKVFSDQLDERTREMDRMIDSIQKSNDALTASLATTLNEIKDINEDLNGDGQSEKSTRDFTSMFNDPNCSSALAAQDVKDAGGAGGLLGILKKASAPLKDAQNIMNEQSQLATEIRNYAGKLGDIYNKTGNADPKLLSPSTLGVEKSTSFLNAVQSVTVDYELVKSEYDNKKKKYDVDGAAFPDILGDKNADVVIQDWRNAYDANCMKDSMGLTIPELMKKVKDPNTSISSSSTNKGDFERFVNNIMKNSAMSLEQKISAIEAEEKKGYASNLSFQAGSSVIVGSSATDQWKVSDYLETVKGKCDSDFKTVKNQYGLTAEDIAREAKTYKAKMDTYKDGMAASIENAVINRMIDCDGIQYDSNAGGTAANCGPDKIKPSSAQFCLKQSVSCAGSIQACYSKADGIVKEAQTKQKALANQYNAKVDKYLSEQRFQLEQLKGAYDAKASMFNKLFPGAKYELPTGLQLTLGEATMNDTYGVKIKDGKSLIASIEGKMTKLKDAMEKQNVEILKQVDERINNLLANAPNEKAYWAGVVSKCTASLNAYNQAQQTADAEGRKQQQQQMNDLNAYCLNHDHAYALAGCEEEASSLYSDAIKVSNMLNPQEMKQNSAYKRLCADFNKNDPSKTTPIDADTFCKNNKTDKVCIDREDYKDCWGGGPEAMKLPVCKQGAVLKSDTTIIIPKIDETNTDSKVGVIWYDASKKLTESINTKIASVSPTQTASNREADFQKALKAQVQIGESASLVTSCGGQDDSAGGAFAGAMKELTQGITNINAVNAQTQALTQ